MNRRASTFWVVSSQMYFILLVFIISVIIVAYIGVASQYSKSYYHTPEELPDDIYLARLLNTCFSEDGRSVIYERVSDQQMENCFIGVLPGLTFRLSSPDAVFTTVTATSGTVAQAQVVTSRYVLVSYGGKLYPGHVEVLV